LKRTALYVVLTLFFSSSFFLLIGVEETQQGQRREDQQGRAAERPARCTLCLFISFPSLAKFNAFSRSADKLLCVNELLVDIIHIDAIDTIGFDTPTTLVNIGV